ncbi:MAG: hypothetical protein H6569_07105 [Lewinellaceae bacterium]|nr:hypothetical protein [Lewinellaceae bacterium]
MKIFLLGLFTALLIIPATTAFAQKKVYMSDAVVSTADQIDFAYKNTVKKAAGKDAEAIVKLMEFSRVLDGSEAIEHARTMLELIPVASDKTLALAIQYVNPKLKKAVLDRMQNAQKKTAFEALKKPIKDWAPYTWETLNNRPLVFDTPGVDKVLDRDIAPSNNATEIKASPKADDGPSTSGKPAANNNSPSANQQAKSKKGGQ